MRTFYGMLICVLTYHVSFSQQKKVIDQDTTTTNIIQIDEVIITGNKKIDPVLTIDVSDYSKKIVQPRNVADLFNEVNGFSIIKRGNYAIDPSFRASQYEQLNVQFDGGTKAMHACPNRMDPVTTHVVPEEIEKIEIIKGPYSVRYGATFGGIINLVTQKPSLYKKGLSGTFGGGYENNGDSFVSMLRLQQVTQKYDLTGNIGYRDFGNYEDGNGTEIPSSFRSTDYGMKIGYNITNNQRLQLHWRQSFGREVLHAGLPMDTDEDNSSILSADYKITNDNKLVNSFNLKGYYSYVDHIMSNNHRPSFMMTEAVSTVEATTIGGKAELQLKPTEKLILYTGIDALHIARDGGRNRLVKQNMMGMPLENPVSFYDKVWQDSYINDMGIFVESKYSLNPKTIVTTGVRYDMVTSEIKDPEADFQALYPHLDKRTEHNVSATASVKYIPAPNFMLEVAYGRGVRSANMIERVINHFTVGQDSYEYVGNPDLDAEVNNQFEIGFKGKEYLKGTFDNFSYGTSFYYSFYNNYIVPVIDESLNKKYMPAAQPQEVKRFVNLDEAYKTGFEIFAEIGFLNNFHFKTELMHVYAKNKDLNESLPLVPPFVTRLKLGFEKENIWANINYTITSKQENIAPSFGEIPTGGYEVMDVRLGLIPIKNLTVGIAALNVFDRTYHNHLNFSFANQSNFDRIPINDPGRNLTAFVQYKF
ncbi:TonB-dependent receptor domain-containing protein [Abyssalbus ytuae]|uniref:TonB-dependent receptor n=1 Tax=Abyssalbus ytuae TaxID=2926907 RepID=A0A9E7CT19_9FLAO|nr:TonB-dependent receptor [Abyssalbus ytuae]UOB17261.1 TonB-dependent receptor [Abyssalbus ytuae]